MADVKREFGVLRARWDIFHYPPRAWSLKTMNVVMNYCVIMQSMIIATEHPDVLNDHG
jgi:hypothetical protein